MNPFPSLTTQRLRLRPLAATDVDFVFAHFADPAIDRFLLDDDPVRTREEAQAIVDFYVSAAGPTPNRWVLERLSDGMPIGTCGLHRWVQRDRCCEVGYDLSPRAQGQGYMTEALRAVLDFGFATLDLNRIEAIVHVDNAASLRLLDRLHFQREGVLRDLHLRDGVFHDHAVLSLLARDWAVTQKPGS